MGSCNTLIVDELVENMDFLQKNLINWKDIIEPEIPEVISLIIQGDSAHFSPELKDVRWREKDQASVNQIMELLQHKKTEISKVKLSKLKYDLKLNKSLSFLEHLKRDHKVFAYPVGQVGFSTITISE